MTCEVIDAPNQAGEPGPSTANDSKGFSDEHRPELPQ